MHMVSGRGIWRIPAPASGSSDRIVSSDGLGDAEM